LEQNAENDSGTRQITGGVNRSVSTPYMINDGDEESTKSASFAPTRVLDAPLRHGRSFGLSFHLPEHRLVSLPPMSTILLNCDVPAPSTLQVSMFLLQCLTCVFQLGLAVVVVFKRRFVKELGFVPIMAPIPSVILALGQVQDGASGIGGAPAEASLLRRLLRHLRNHLDVISAINLFVLLTSLTALTGLRLFSPQSRECVLT
jgi:hypothetical protein